MRNSIINLIAMAALGEAISREDYPDLSPNKGKMGRKQAHLTPKQLKARKKARAKRKNKKSHK